MKSIKKFKITPTPKTKILVFVLTVIFFILTTASIFIVNQMIADNIYKKTKEEILLERYDSLLLEDSEQILTYLHKDDSDSQNTAATFCAQKNFISVKSWTNNDTYDPELERYHWSWKSGRDASGVTIKHIWRRIGTEFMLWDDYTFTHSKDYIFLEVTIAQSEKLVDDAYWDIYRSVSAAYFWRFPIYAIGIILFLLGLGGFVYLMRHNTLLPKLAKWLHRILFTPLGQKLCPKIRWGWKQFSTYIAKTPFLLKISFLLIIFLLPEYIILRQWFGKHSLYNDIVLFWLVEKCIIIPAVFYFAIYLRKLIESGKALASGDLSHTTNTRFMIGDLKEHGEDLNRIANGMSIAVEERLKSERMKTELITNVTHDIKTPLTSIMNYADLLKKELITVSAHHSKHDEVSSIVMENEKFQRIDEYSSVLHRHSQRLKRLIEDLLEASKAATGNLDVYLEPCEAAIMLTQAAGEFEQRMESAGLTLITKYPEQPIPILADGRRLWRIFDNLLSNICKYALSGTRVYLTLEKQDGFAVITFKNTSKDALDIAPEELMERFTRADTSRHTEGNGLGLAIAKSLTELQHGTMDLLIDGDLFKVILRFPVYQMER